MDPRALLRPVGPLPVAVYWRRRVVLLAVVVVVAVLLGSLTGGGGRAGASPHRSSATHYAAASGPGTSGAAKPAARAGATPIDAPVRRPVRPCAARQVRLAVSTDHARYPAGVAPRFVLTVTGAGARPCTLDVGPGARSFLVRSGVDRIWFSADCARAARRVVTLRPGQRIAYSLTWSRHRSAAGCPSAAEVAALPGTYRVVGKVGRLTSDDAVFVLAAG